MTPDEAIKKGRLLSSEVCALGRFGKSGLRRRRERGMIPAPVDRAREDIYDAKAVVKALFPECIETARNPFDAAFDGPDAD